MNPEVIESIHSTLLKCGIAHRDPIKTGSSAVYLSTGDKVTVISHYVDESDNFYIVRMPDGSIRDTTHDRLIIPTMSNHSEEATLSDLLLSHFREHRTPNTKIGLLNYLRKVMLPLPSYECPVCLDDTITQETLLLTCGHTICGKCEPLLKGKCPICRGRFAAKDIF